MAGELWKNPVRSVKLVGGKKAPAFKQTEEGLEVTLNNAEKPSDISLLLKIE